MPRRIIKRFLPKDDTLKKHKSLGVFGKLILAPNLWHLNKRSFSGAFVVGLFCAFIPVPFQMVFAAAGAMIVRVNLPVSVALVWITNPLTIPPMFYFAYRVGAWTLDRPPSTFDFQLSFDWLKSELGHIWEPLILGSLICGILSAALGYVLARLLWRYLVIKSWNKRRRNRI